MELTTVAHELPKWTHGTVCKDHMGLTHTGCQAFACSQAEDKIKVYCSGTMTTEGLGHTDHLCY